MERGREGERERGERGRGRDIRAFRPVRICVYTSVIQKCITVEKFKRAAFHISASERENILYARPLMENAAHNAFPCSCEMASSK